MKMFIFLIVITLVVSGLILTMQKSRTEEDLAMRKVTKRRRKQKKEALTPQKHMTWPVIIRPVSDASGADSEPEHLEEKPLIEEPSMTSIEFELPEHPET